MEIAVKPWVNDPTIIEALSAQNERTRTISHREILRLDRVWRQETRSVDKPMIESILSTDLSHFLKRVRASSQGLLTEIFVMDLRGLNVGQSDVTSDYWQGDEDKWRKSCLAGRGAVFIDDVEEDESTQQFQSQVSLAIQAPGTQQVIGCITVGIDVDLAADLEF